MSQCRRDSLRVTAALLEALGVPEQVGLPAEVCVARLLDVEAFLGGTEGGTKREANTVATGRLHPEQSNCSKAG